MMDIMRLKVRILQNEHKGIAPLRVLCLCVFRKQHPVVDIVITGNLPAVVSIEFDDFRKIVINCIKFKILFMAPFDCFRQSLAGAAGPENELVAITFPFLKIFDQCLVGLTELRPFAVTQGTVKIDSDCLEI